MKKINLFLILIFSLLITTNPSLAQTSETTCPNLKFNLSLNSNDKTTNGEVKKLQNFLIKNGYMSVAANGNYGPSTTKAVKLFQKNNNIIVTGVVGKVTRGVVNQVGCGNTNTNTINIKDRITKQRLISFKQDYLNLCFSSKENTYFSNEEFRSRLSNIINKNFLLQIKFEDFSGAGIFSSPEIKKIVEEVDLKTCIDINPAPKYKEVKAFYDKTKLGFVIESEDVLKFIEGREGYNMLYAHVLINGLNSGFTMFSGLPFLAAEDIPNGGKFISRNGQTLFLRDVYATVIILGDNFDYHKDLEIKELDTIKIGFSFSGAESGVVYTDLNLRPRNAYLQDVAEAVQLFK